MENEDIGEREFLSKIKHLVRKIPGSRLGFDDDASDIPLNEESIVINVDTFVTSTDKLPGMSYAQAGRKTAVMTLSDLAAKGASPQGMLLSACIGEDSETGSIYECIRGFSQYCLKSDVPFLGGDLGHSKEIILTGVGIGKASPADIVKRSGAQLGDIITVTDIFGLSSVAFKVLIDGYSAEENLRNRAIKAAYKPSIHPRIISELSKASLATSSMDSSDGLGITLNTMAQHSGNLFLIDRLPVAAGVEGFAESHDLDVMELVMQGGEEFSLVLTVLADQWDDAVAIAEREGTKLLPIGKVREGSGVRYVSDSTETVIPAKGYDVFKKG
ncbi:MAG: thiamine-phosphate kinase [Promethearchaeia archaeon]